MFNRKKCQRATHFLLAIIAFTDFSIAGARQSPIVGGDVVFAVKDGVAAVEAEHFFQQKQTADRAFHLMTSVSAPEIEPDGDPIHVGAARGGAYLEILPDIPKTHADKLIRGKNFSPDPGRMAVLSYRVHVELPGRYYVWARAYSTGGEDNGLHVGLDGNWPESGQRLQWCEGQQSWRWESKQRPMRNTKFVSPRCGAR